ncbi:MAG: hypothetical protein K6F15_01510 [Treponema sp.]|nr:hypothetical protein [Treponema sp.]
MKNIFLAFGLALSFLILSCSSVDDSKNQKALALAMASGAVTVNITTPTGSSVYTVDSATNRIQSCRTTNSEDNIVVNRTYTYNDTLGSRSIEVEHPYSRKVTIYYEDSKDNSSRSVASDENEEIPGKVRRCVKVTEGDSSRGITSSEEETTYEYYYNEDGSVAGILKVDSYGNVWSKGE